jgi:hypothetical protein
MECIREKATKTQVKRKLRFQCNWDLLIAFSLPPVPKLCSSYSLLLRQLRQRSRYNEDKVFNYAFTVLALHSSQERAAIHAVYISLLTRNIQILQEN